MLDIILDVFSVHLATHHSFFIALLSFSPWGNRTHDVKQEDMAVEPDPAQYRGKSLMEVLKIAEAQAGARLDDVDSSNARVLAQVLGFKFRYYQVGERSSRWCIRIDFVQSLEVSESAPQNLYLMTALLIREGFLRLEDLYPHVRDFHPFCAYSDSNLFYCRSARQTTKCRSFTKPTWTISRLA